MTDNNLNEWVGTEALGLGFDLVIPVKKYKAGDIDDIEFFRLLFSKIREWYNLKIQNKGINMLRLQRLNVYRDDEVRFMYDTRFHQDVMLTLLSSQTAPTYDEHVSYLRKKDKEDHQLFFICYAENSDMVGYCQSKMIRENVWELGWVINPNFQGKGYGKKSVELLLNEVQKMGAVSAELVVVKENLKAIHIYESFGFKTINDCGDSWRMTKPMV